MFSGFTPYFTGVGAKASSARKFHNLAVCLGIALSGASWAGEQQARTQEDPVLVESPDPGYYMKLTGMKPGESGTAQIQACVDEKGRITRSAVSASSRNRALDAAAVAVVSHSRFRAGIVNGKPKAICAVFQINITAPPTAGEFDRLPERLPNRTRLVASRPQSVEYDGLVSAEDINKGGRVTVLICSDDTGRVIGTTVLTPSASPALDRSAVKTADRYRFSPAQENGKPVGSCTLLPVIFPPQR
jgi:TonB family protein